MLEPIKLDKMRNFRFGMKAISLLEKKLKKNIGAIDLENITMEDAAVLIWAGLQHEDKELTPDKVMDLIDDYSDITTVFSVMVKSLERSFGNEKSGEDGERDQFGKKVAGAAAQNSAY